MFFLLLPVASLLFFLLVVVLMYVAESLESRQRDRKNLDSRVLVQTPPFALLSMTEAFDPIFAVLWQAPTDALQLAAASGRSGVPASRLRPIYRQAAARFPEIYDGCSFWQWLQFLEQNRLILWLGSNVALSADGRAFLKYRFVSEGLVEEHEDAGVARLSR